MPAAVCGRPAFPRPRLLAVWRIALPGALAQIVIGRVPGAAIGALAFGLDRTAAIVFGLARHLLHRRRRGRWKNAAGSVAKPGRIALGWLVVQDLVVVLALVLLPALAYTGDGSLPAALATTALQLIAFLGAMAIGGRLLLPRLLARVAATGSRELMPSPSSSCARHGIRVLGAVRRLAGAGRLFRRRAAEARSVTRRGGYGAATATVALFFVSVGGLVDPAAMFAMPWTSVATVLAVLLGTGGAILGLLLALRVPLPAAATVAGAMAQIGEFSLLLAQARHRRGPAAGCEHAALSWSQ